MSYQHIVQAVGIDIACIYTYANMHMSMYV